ncbi:MAG: SurA N-terminal domain-containing protein [Anaerolineales bacterium]
MKSARTLKPIILVLLAGILLVSGCTGTGRDPAASATPILPTRTPFPPSPTPIPTAAVVNGDLITMAEYQEELARYKAAVGRDLTPEDQQIVINQLVDLTLLAQAAKTEGYQVSDSTLDERIAALDTDEQPLDDWLAANGFTLESFRAYLKRSLEAAWMRDEIIAAVPYEVEQIHAQQMLFYDLPTAELSFQELEKGVDFTQLAGTYDPQTKGDLGWFPEGFLTQPELDPILFSLEVGETSDIIETEIGYHILKVLDKQTSRPLDPAIRQILQEKALVDWMDRRWKLSTIEITLPT